MATYLVNFISIVLGLLLALVAALFYLMGSANSSDDAPVLKMSLSIEQFWLLDYDGMIPAELKLPGTLVAENRDGFTDIVFIGVFHLQEKDADTLLRSVQTNFVQVNNSTSHQEFVVNAICEGKSNFSSAWAVEEALYPKFKDFCSFASSAKTSTWDFQMKLDETDFNYLSISHYQGTNYFTVYHGQS